MPYPLLSEYIESIKSPADFFDQLKHLRPDLNDDGTPVMTSGNFAVVFKMKDEEIGQFYAVKCFLRDQERRSESYRLISEQLKDVNSSYLTTIKYLENEIYVDTKASQDREFPVLLMDWVEGKTLDKYIRDNMGDQYELSMLAYRFSQLAMWLLPQPFAHGDLKPDNIIVKEDGSLVLVDYDGMYVPAMKGQLARELGSPDFRHPLRTDRTFNEHIDDFSAISILLSLKAISIRPSLLDHYGASDRLVFSERDYRDSSNSEVLRILHTFGDKELNTLCNVFTVALNEQTLSNVSLQQLSINKIIHEEFVFSDIDEYVPVYDPSTGPFIKLLDLEEDDFTEEISWLCHHYSNLLEPHPHPNAFNLKKGDRFWLLKKMPSVCSQVVSIGEYSSKYIWIGIPTSIGKIPYGFFNNWPHDILNLYDNYYGEEIIVLDVKYYRRNGIMANQNRDYKLFSFRYPALVLDKAYKYLSKEQYEKDELAFREQELPSHNGHKYVDLGLSVKWATCNVGANNPEDFGEYYAWGETNKKLEDIESLWYGSYINSPMIGGRSYRLFPNEKLIPSNDVAHYKWGGDWRMPTKEEFKELIENCDCLWTTQNNVAGLKITSKKQGFRDQYIFLPACGSKLQNDHRIGLYWSSSLVDLYSDLHSYIFRFRYNIHEICNGEISNSLSVRPVCT